MLNYSKSCKIILIAITPIFALFFAYCLVNYFNKPICLGKYKDANNYELEKYNRKIGLIILSLVIVLYLIIVMLILGLIMLAIHRGSKG